MYIQEVDCSTGLALCYDILIPYTLIENIQVYKSMFKEALLRATVSFLSHWSDRKTVRTLI